MYKVSDLTKELGLTEASPSPRKRRPSSEKEHRVQCACVRWFRCQYPAMRHNLFAVPNGGARNKIIAAKLKAEGEAEYMRMLAAAYDNEDKQDFYEFTLALDALKSSLDGDQKTVILDGNSELARILMGAE